MDTAMEKPSMAVSVVTRTKSSMQVKFAAMLLVYDSEEDACGEWTACRCWALPRDVCGIVHEREKGCVRNDVMTEAWSNKSSRRPFAGEATNRTSTLQKWIVMICMVYDQSLYSPEYFTRHECCWSCCRGRVVGLHS
jgi:hypothetical protein